MWKARTDDAEYVYVGGKVIPKHEYEYKRPLKRWLIKKGGKE